MNRKIVRKVPYYLCKKDYAEVENILQNFSGFEDYELIFSRESIEYKMIPGKMAYYLNEEEICDLGIYIAKFHKNASCIESDYIPKQFYTHFPNLSKETICLMRRCLNNILQNDSVEFKIVFEMLDYIVDNYYFDNLPKQIIHGDLHPGNIIIDENGQFHLIDLFDFHYNYKIIDIAWLLLYYFFWDTEHKRINKSLDSKLMRKMIDSYNSVYPLNNIERNAFVDVTKILLISSLFCNHSLWRNKRLGENFYNNLISIKKIFEKNQIDELRNLS